jgi:hypothetical protein
VGEKGAVGNRNKGVVGNGDRDAVDTILFDFTFRRLDTSRVPNIRALRKPMTKGPNSYTPALLSTETTLGDKKKSLSLDAAVLHNALHKHKQALFLYGNFYGKKTSRKAYILFLPKHVV